MTPPLLHLCARATTCPELALKIRESVGLIDDWSALLDQAEGQGLAPLLHWHLDNLEIDCPDQFRRAARLLYLRHRHAHTLYAQVLDEVLTALTSAGIAVLVLKGAALCHTIYPEIGLRPMRDIDLLLRQEESQRAQDLLIGKGFSESKAPRPADHFHLPSLHKTIAGQSICIELHHGLFPDCPPYYQKLTFDDLLGRSLTFDLNGTKASCLGLEDMLWHVFNHGFRPPLTYEPFKLIAAADIITLVEKNVHQIDWQRMQTAYPEVMAALPFFHYLTPWSEEVRKRFVWKTVTAVAGAGKAFQGWPHLRLAEQRDRSLLEILRATFLPPEWWCRIYYGITTGAAWYRCRLLTHPRHIFWWVRLYASFLDANHADSAAPPESGVRHFLRQIGALYRKLF